MPRKKVDNRIRVVIENGVVARHRSMVVVVGEKGRDQVVLLHHMLSKATVKARPSVLWCYKKDLGFSRYMPLDLLSPCPAHKYSLTNPWAPLDVSLCVFLSMAVAIARRG